MHEKTYQSPIFLNTKVIWFRMAYIFAVKVMWGRHQSVIKGIKQCVDLLDSFWQYHDSCISWYCSIAVSTRGSAESLYQCFCVIESLLHHFRSNTRIQINLFESGSTYVTNIILCKHYFISNRRQLHDKYAQISSEYNYTNTRTLYSLSNVQSLI